LSHSLFIGLQAAMDLRPVSAVIPALPSVSINSCMALSLLGGSPARLGERAAQDRATWTPIIAGLNLSPDK